ncbi:outer membrane beta-barrel protein [Candidatus Calescamantes bacterium]|nr:outer membrane beta-barrel protein [Candidatus Calescamantes bacterium]
MGKKVKGILFLGLCFLMVAFYAQGEGLKIKPSLNISSEYHSNINLSSDDAEKSWITYVRPGISIQAPLENFYAELDYLPTFAYFSKDKDYNYKADSLKAVLRYNVGPRLSIGFKDNYEETELPDKSQIENEGDVYRKNTLGVALKYQVENNWSLELGSEGETFKDPTDDPFTDYKDSVTYLKLRNNFTPRTYLAVTPSFGKRDFDDSEVKDYDSIRVGLELGHKFNAIWSGKIAPSWEYRNYTEAERDTAKNVNWNVNLSARSGKGSLSFDYSQSIEDTFREKYIGPSYYNSSELRTLSSNYRYTRIEKYGVNFGYKFSRALKFNVGGFYQRNVYPDEIVLTNDQVADKDKAKSIFHVYQAGFDYQLNKWISLGLTYRFVDVNNDPEDDYHYSVVSGGIRASISF